MFAHVPPTLRRLFVRRERTQPKAIAGIRPELCAQLGLNPQLGARLLEPGSPPPGFRYRHFAVPKRDGSRRELVEPGPRLKTVQRAIVALLHENTPHAAALGFRRGLSIADHAWAHAGAAMIITADIQDFFGSTTRGRIEGWWRQRGYTDTEALLLTRLTTYRGALPQGAPSSPPLSNLVNVDLDQALERLARSAGATYTRYADDLAFSWPDGAEPALSFERAVGARLHENGYALHPIKGWHMWRRRDEPEITGLVLNKRGGVELPPELQTIMRVLARSRQPDDQARLRGYYAYQAMIERS